MATPKNNSVAKAFQILNALSGSRGDMTASEVARAVGGTVATVHRFLMTLEELGVVARNAHGRYQLGMVLADLGDRVEHNKLLLDAVQPHLDALAARYREAAHVAVRNGKWAAYVAHSLPDRSLQLGHGAGVVPLHCSALGKVLLAGLRGAERERVLAGLELERHTAATIADRPRLAAELDRIALQGHAADNEEWEEGLRGVAVPIHDGHGQVVAAMGVSGPASRFDHTAIARCRDDLAARAGQVARRLFMESRTLPNKARPRGSFPHLKRVGDFVFISGTSARRPDDSFDGVRIDPDGRVRLDIRRQTRAVFENINDMLASVGASLADLVDVQAYLASIEDYDGFNAVYAEFFGPDGPTRTTVAVAGLPHPHQLLMVRGVAHKPLVLG